jgi:dolichol-phosphate mannosyltransferase
MSNVEPKLKADASPEGGRDAVATSSEAIDLSVVIPAWNEADNLAKLVPQLHQVLADLGCKYEIIVVDNHSADGTEQVCTAAGAVVVHQTERGYGGALWAGFGRAQGEYILTMDADLSHLPDFAPRMWNHRQDAEVIIASRYVEGGSAEYPGYRHALSIVLNTVYTRLLSLPVKDISSGFRLYRTAVLRELDLQSTDFDALEEILIKCYARGYRIAEIPFRFVPRDQGKSKVKLLQFGLAYLKTLVRMWKLRNSVASADYDARAFDSVIPLQRYWQRARHRIITNLVDAEKSCLDIGCGSSRILGALNERSIGLDIQLNKLRYSRRYGRPLVNASILALPFADHRFEQVLCSQVIEHLPAGPQPFVEMGRVLAEGGRLILGTPDYGPRRAWPIIERLYGFFAPGAYADEHITHYSSGELVRIMEAQGFHFRCARYILNSELIMLFDKSESANPADPADPAKSAGRSTGNTGRSPAQSTGCSSDSGSAGRTTGHAASTQRTGED